MAIKKRISFLSDKVLKWLNSRKVLLSLLGIVMASGTLMTTLWHRQERTKIEVLDRFFADIEKERKQQERDAFYVTCHYIDLIEQIKKYYSYNQDSDDFIFKAASAELEFRELANSFCLYSDTIANRARKIANFYAGHCKQKTLFHAQIKETIFTKDRSIIRADIIAKNAQDNAQAKKYLYEMQDISDDIGSNHMFFFSDTQKSHLRYLLREKFGNDLDQYESAVKFADSDRVKMAPTQWPQVILYKELVDIS